MSSTSHAKQAKIQSSGPANKASEATTKATSKTATQQLPAWTNAWGNNPPVGLFSHLDAITPSTPPIGDEAASASVAPGNILFKEREDSVNSVKGVSSSQSLHAQLGSGHALDNGVRSNMEAAFETDFSHVRLHTDTHAAGISESLNARAFTVGQHVAFGPGEYQPGTPVGDALIAHELAHVVQQRGVSTSLAQPKLLQGEGENSAFERDADRSAMSAVSMIWRKGKGVLASATQNIKPALQSGLRIQRCSKSTPVPTVAPERVQFKNSYSMIAHSPDPKANSLWTPGASDHAVAYAMNANPVVDARFKIASDLFKTPDAGTPGSGTSDAGASKTDAGTATTDAGAPKADAGTADAGAGTGTPDAGTIKSVTVRLKEGGNIRANKAGITPGTNSLDVTDLNLIGLSGSDGVRSSSYNFTWEGSIDGTTWVSLGTTGPHPVHWVYATPLAAPLYNYAVSKAAGYASGANDIASVSQAIRSGPRGVDGLTYDPQDAINADPLTVYADGKGICTDYGNLLTLLARSIGLNANAVMFFGGFESLGKNIWVTLGGSLINLINVKSPNPAFNPAPTPISPAGWAFNYHVISRIENILQDAALDRQGIDAQAVHDGKIIRLVEPSPAGLPTAKKNQPYSQVIPRKDQIVHVDIRDYGPQIADSVFNTDIIPLQIPLGAPPTIDVSVNWALDGASGPLPVGLSLDASTGIISGTTTVTGTFPILIKVTASPKLFNTFPLTLKVNP